MRIKSIITLFCFLVCSASRAQLANTYFDVIDSLIETTPEIDLCQKNGKDDERFFTKTPEKYSDYKQVFTQMADTTFVFTQNSHFFCQIDVTINCEGKAGNYYFSIEPRTFTMDDYQQFLKLIEIIRQLQGSVFSPAVYLGEKVNSKAKFRLSAKGGKASLQ